uniref:Carbohydrate ABC transporter permease n=1 Tax=Anaerolinea thermolimosa TaxID=229919 RepID=A0A7C4PK72_9CHLR
MSLHFGYKTQTRIWHALIILIIGLVCIVFMVPLVLIFSASFTSSEALANTGYRLIPPMFSLEAYEFLLNDPSIVTRAYGVSIFVTLVGTGIGVTVMSMLAFVLSRRDLKLRGLLTFYIFFTMLFSGGLVPYYINMVRTLHLKNTVTSLILPYLVSPFYVLLLRTYFTSLPKELFDSAKIDGAGEFRIFYQIAVPLSVPSILTISLFLLLVYWNDMFQALLFIESTRLWPLQYTLYNMIVSMSQVSEMAMQIGKPVPALSVRMAMAVLALGPVILAFPFVQRYFVRGITLGSIKGD